MRTVEALVAKASSPAQRAELQRRAKAVLVSLATTYPYPYPYP